MTSFRAALLGLAGMVASPALAGNTLVPGDVAVAVAKSPLTVKPAGEWNRLAARPGRNAETWTLDGDTLNDLTFYGGIVDGQPILREVSKKSRPLPRFAATMLLSDVPTLFEQSYRVANDTALMEIRQTEPVTFAGRKGIRFTYQFTRPGEDVRRLGEAYATIAGGTLYMVAFEAPAIHYFDAGIAAARTVIARTVIASAAIVGAARP